MESILLHLTNSTHSIDILCSLSNDALGHDHDELDSI